MLRFWLAIAAFIATAAPAFAADHVKVGTTRLIGYVSVPVGIAEGYFQAEGIDVEQVYFDSAQPIAVAAASGGVDFGIAGPSAGFYNLAAQGQVKLIGASGGDSKGFHALEFLASNKAWDAGLKSPHDLPGHTVAITQLGTALHNVIGILAERDGFALNAIEVKPLQSNNVVSSALIGGTVDAAVMPNGPILNLVDKGQIKFLGWTSDYAPLKAGVMLLGAKSTLEERGDVVKRFLIAYRKASHDIHEAFTGPGEVRQDGPNALAIVKIISEFTGQPPSQIEAGAPYVQSDARIDIAGYAKQIDWLRSQGLLKDSIRIEDLIDKRYALTTGGK
ncbi:MAG TPA: ABC transporter substrate-binding protein [Stellaceae bacterium]|jgi:NitT/TauT family transport system substrate-binding protein|nr:ABC transporter substrate-binding protein [Stellaceae bacterium]